MFVVALILIVVLAGIDQLLKLLVNAQIEIGQVIEVIKIGGTKIFSLTHVRNSGAAWSMMSGKTWFLIGFPILVCLAALIYLYFIRNKNKLEVISIALFVAGGIGNLIDRIRLHEVIDYIMFEPINFPIFNFADICVVIGVVLFMISMLIGNPKNEVKSK